jgi:hypothetical protein
LLIEVFFCCYLGVVAAVPGGGVVVVVVLVVPLLQVAITVFLKYVHICARYPITHASG